MSFSKMVKKILWKNTTNLVQSGCEAVLLLRRNLRAEGQKREPWGGEANGGGKARLQGTHWLLGKLFLDPLRL